MRKNRSQLFTLALITLGITIAFTQTSFAVNLGSKIGIGKDVFDAVTIKEEDVKKSSRLSAEQMDKQHKVAPAGSKYAKRLNAIVKGYENHDGLKLNFKVYLVDEVNAFAMPDGTVRVYSGLLDLMPDDQVFAVIGHEIGHVKLRHSFNQMRKQLLTNAAFKTAASSGGSVGDLTNSQLGELGYGFVNSSFSKKDEYASDSYSVKFLHKEGKDPSAMTRSIKTIEEKYGSGSGFLSSHPSNPNRIKKIEKSIKKL